MMSFYLNDQLLYTTEPVASALLDFVRYHEHLTGTKIGCREGDCGACTVLVGELADDNQRIAYQSMTSCLTPLGNVHGKHVAVLYVHFLDTPGHPSAILRAKAVGEPPLLYGIGAYFALRDAIRAFQPRAALPLVAPLPPERVLTSLYPEFVAVEKLADSRA